MIIFLILLSSSFVVATECDVGIDGVCDLNCLEDDFDCPNNPNNKEQDVFCNPEVDGICDIRCEFSDIDCSIQKREKALFQESNYNYYGDNSSRTFISQFDKKTFSTTQIILIISGLILVMLVILFSFHRAREKINERKYAALIPYGQAALEKGYSFQQIRKSLSSQGYNKDFINGYMEALEHRP